MTKQAARNFTTGDLLISQNGLMITVSPPPQRGRGEDVRVHFRVLPDRPHDRLHDFEDLCYFYS